MRINITKAQLHEIEEGFDNAYISRDELLFIKDGLLPGESDEYQGNLDYQAYDN